MYPYMGVQFNSTVLISIFITFWAQATIIGLLVVVWLSGISRWSRSTKFYPTSGPVSTGMGDRLRVRVAFAPSPHLIKHPGQLSLAIPPWVGKTSTAAMVEPPLMGKNDEFCIITADFITKTDGILT